MKTTAPWNGGDSQSLPIAAERIRCRAGRRSRAFQHDVASSGPMTLRQVSDVSRTTPSIPDGLLTSHGPAISSGCKTGRCVYTVVTGQLLAIAESASVRIIVRRICILN